MILAYGKVGYIDMNLHESFSRKIFNTFNIIFMMIVVVITLYPMLYVAFGSLSIPSRFIAHRGILLAPLGFSLEAYRSVFKNPMILTGYMNTIFVVTVGLAFNMVFTSLGAYFLSRKNIMLKNTIMFLITFTMFFSGGLIPFYLAVKSLNIDNTLWALIIPSTINTFYLLIMRTAFQRIPESLEESAKLDGAGHFTILLRIILPLSMPTIAVMILYYGVSHWNAWFHASIFLRNREMFPLQLVLRDILIDNKTDEMALGVGAADRESVSQTIKYAVIMVATIPILTLYPFLQKYFVKGALLGAIKG